ncbi:hypothetical protein CA13_34530 [Planctomycetes bacterium CA13]|uniref:Uncharacterized protein n=1 Tax=Novipirellula herctigrandis TaxID=2527986 RepID=A0A5C5Z3S7_9BACT|nr:hypothetical protein CA13_34530 [Planctomycetes bacterium CA13]
MNHRVEGTEKCWDDGDSGEAILHVWAALISDGCQLNRHIAGRPGSHCTWRTKKERQIAITGFRFTCLHPLSCNWLL